MSEQRRQPPPDLEPTSRSCPQGAFLEDLLLAFVAASPADRARLVHEARAALASAGLDRAVLQEALDARLADDLEGPLDLRAELEDVDHRVEEGARALLGLRAAAAATAFRT